MTSSRLGGGLPTALLAAAAALFPGVPAPAAPASGRGAVGAHPRDPKVAWVWQEARGLSATVDGGETWRALESPRLVYKIVFGPAGDVVWLATDEGVLRSADGGKTWGRAAVGRAGKHALDVAVVGDPPAALLGMKEGLYGSTDGGVTWKVVSSDVPFIRAVWAPNPSNGKDLLVASQPWAHARPDEVPNAKVLAKGLFRTVDAGWKWSRNLSPDGGAIVDLAITPGHPETLWVVTDLRGVFRSLTGGDSWKAVTPPSP